MVFLEILPDHLSQLVLILQPWQLQSTHLMMDQKHSFHEKLFYPFSLALITLGCGGSAGKEGPCSYIGAGVAAGVGRALQLNAELRKRLVACGVSAGFASVFGTPIAGAIYGVEMLAIGRIRHDFLFPGIIAGVTAFQVSKYMGVL